jgi:predicted nicotinamide N-methyase
MLSKKKEQETKGAFVEHRFKVANVADEQPPEANVLEVLRSTGLPADAATVRVWDELAEHFGAFTWASALALASYLFATPSTIAPGTKVVELGAGTGLPGLLAAVMGAEVVLTDAEKEKRVLENLNRSIVANGLCRSCSVMPLTWGRFAPPALALEPDVVLGADVMYSYPLMDSVMSSVACLLRSARQRGKGVFIMTYCDRGSSRAGRHLLEKWEMDAEEVPLHSFMPSHICEQPRFRSIYLLKLRFRQL